MAVRVISVPAAPLVGLAATLPCSMEVAMFTLYVAAPLVPPGVPAGLPPGAVGRAAPPEAFEQDATPTSKAAHKRAAQKRAVIFA